MIAHTNEDDFRSLLVETLQYAKSHEDFVKRNGRNTMLTKNRVETIRRNLESLLNDYDSGDYKPNHVVLQTIHIQVEEALAYHDQRDRDNLHDITILKSKLTKLTEENAKLKEDLITVKSQNTLLDEKVSELETQVIKLFSVIHRRTRIDGLETTNCNESGICYKNGLEQPIADSSS